MSVTDTPSFKQKYSTSTVYANVLVLQIGKMSLTQIPLPLKQIKSSQRGGISITH